MSAEQEYTEVAAEQAATTGAEVPAPLDSEAAPSGEIQTPSAPGAAGPEPLEADPEPVAVPNLAEEGEATFADAEAPAVEPADAVRAEAPVDEVASAREEAAKYLQLAQRTQADFDNFRRRAARESAAAADRGTARLAKELLPALDQLELALQASEQDPAGADLAKGVRLVQDELVKALGRAGIQAYSPRGERFDPEQHEAMAQLPAEGVETGMVVEVFQQGYRLNGTVLRPARVVVAA